MNIPDYINPIVGYRCWNFDGLSRTSAPRKLKSFNGLIWEPLKKFEATCSNVPVYLHVGHTKDDNTAIPCSNCTCGVYAFSSLSLDLLTILTSNYSLGSVTGEIYMWGKIIQHSDGYRAQYAYPRCFYIPTESLRSIYPTSYHYESYVLNVSELSLEFQVPVVQVHLDTTHTKITELNRTECLNPGLDKHTSIEFKRTETDIFIKESVQHFVCCICQENPVKYMGEDVVTHKVRGYCESCAEKKRQALRYEKYKKLRGAFNE